MKLIKVLFLLTLPFNAFAWECEINGKINEDIKPEGHYSAASDVVFGMIMSGHFTQTAERRRTYNYTVKIFHSFKGDLTGEQTITFEDNEFLGNFEIGQSYLFTFMGNTQLNFCSFYFPLYIENRDANTTSIKRLSENPNYIPEQDLKRLFWYLKEDN